MIYIAVYEKLSSYFIHNLSASRLYKADCARVLWILWPGRN